MAVGHPVRLTEETQRVFDAVALDASPPRAFLGLVEGGADVDRKAEIGLFQLVNESDNVVGLIEDGSHRADARNAIHNGVEVQSRSASPVNNGIQFLRWTKNSAVARIAHIDRVVFAGDFEESPLLLDGVLVVDAACCKGKNDVVVLQTFADPYR